MDLRIKIEVKISELIGHLENNKTQHIEDYALATENYFIQLRNVLDEMATDALSGVIRNDGYRVQLQPPVNESDKYDKYIQMLGMARDDYLEIGTDEYERFVNDEWNWAISAKLLNSSYMSNIS